MNRRVSTSVRLQMRKKFEAPYSKCCDVSDIRSAIQKSVPNALAHRIYIGRLTSCRSIVLQF